MIKIEYRLECNYCHNVSPVLPDIDTGIRGWQGSGDQHFCCQEHRDLFYKALEAERANLVK